MRPEPKYGVGTSDRYFTDRVVNNIIDLPMPKYNKCNKGHTLVLMYDERANRNVWDCPTCIESMRRVGLRR